jgi:hypothetical protein
MALLKPKLKVSALINETGDLSQEFSNGNSGWAFSQVWLK